MDSHTCDYYHETNARKQGMQVLVGVHVFSLICLCLAYSAPPLLEQISPGGRLASFVATAFGWVLLAIALIAYALLGLYSLHLIRTGGRWLLCIRDGRLIVESPSETVGNTFTTEIDRIDAVIREEAVVAHGGAEATSVTDTEYYVLLESGEEYWISSNSQADLVELTKKLKELNPAICEVEREA